MVVRDCMTAPVEVAHPDETVRTLRDRLRRRGIRHMPVVATNQVIGIVTDRDVRSGNADPYATVETIMTSNPVTVAPSTPIERAATLLHRHKIGALPVLEGETLVGIVAESDLLRALLEIYARPEAPASHPSA
jgi:acetoin utilization protein AcuB